MPLPLVDGSVLDPVSIHGVDEAYIVRNPSLEELLFDRSASGLRFVELCEASSEQFLRHFAPEIEAKGDDISELMMLSKGFYYRLHGAYATVFRRNLEINFAATQRVAVSGRAAEVVIPYCNFDAPTRTLVIGDTLATGASIEAALRAYQDLWPLDHVIVFCMVGSGVGAQALARYCRATGVRLTIAYGLAVFGLGANGFDLSFLHPDTITRDEYVCRARELYGDRQISAAGWDFGSQAQATRKYRMLCWLESQYHDAADIFPFREGPSEPRLISKEKSALTPACSDALASVDPSESAPSLAGASHDARFRRGSGIADGVPPTD